MKRTFATYLLFLCTCRLASQTETTVTLLTVNDDLLEGMIFDMLQSRDSSPRVLGGFIWIATKDGLTRYEGFRFNDPFNPFAIDTSRVEALFKGVRVACFTAWKSHGIKPQSG